MGTRGLTVIVKDKTIKLSNYQQWDSYFSYTGVKFLEFCRENLSSKYKIEDFCKKVDLLEPITQEIQNLINETTANFDISTNFKIPSLQLFPQFHRDTGVKILDIIDSLKTYDFHDSQKFPVYIDTDLVCIEYINIIDLDNNKIYMLRIQNDKFKSLETTDLIEERFIKHGFECYLSYKLGKIPSKNTVFKHYKKVEVE